MRKKFLKWLIGKFPKGEVEKELRKQIRKEFPGFHLSKNPIRSGKRKKVEVKNELGKVG